MNKAIAFLVLLALSFNGAPAPAQTQDETPAPTTPIYDDAAVHFEPAKDWIRVPYASAAGDDSGGKLQPVAFYIHNPGKENQQKMILEMEPFRSPVAEWESSLENEFRAQFEGALIRKSETKLANGMPAYWINLTFGSGFSTQKLYGYAVADGRRGIFMGVIGRLGLIDENEIKVALGGLKVVLYPRWRR